MKARRWPWIPVKLQTSFRSGAAVLEAVDIVFKNDKAHAGFVSDRAGTAHERACPMPRRAWSISGRWCCRTTRTTSKDGTRRSTPRARRARRCGSRARSRSRSRAGSGTGWQPSDIIVLVRQRGALFESDHPRAEGGGHSGRRRRPPGAHRAHRGDGHDGARRRAAAAGGRSRPRRRRSRARSSA